MRASSHRSSSTGGNAATGLLFVGVVMVVLFAGGIGAVLATGSDPPPPAVRGATASRVSAKVAADGTSGSAAARQAAVRRLAEMVSLRDAALSRRDVALLDRIYAPGSVNRRIDRASIAQMRRQHVRWIGLSTSVQVVEASPAGARQWTILAAFACAPARLVTESGRQVKAEPARRQLLRFSMVLPPGGRDWLLLRIAPVQPAG
ncbi:MAG TPA: hypothetical protein VG276_22810 [Actinomycetes bacterium]|jgi:hypothetical protein|nr:hypothetical protein [Actinomycetes bacterium]